MSKRIKLEDCWPLQLQESLVEFEVLDGLAQAIVFTFKKQSMDLAPLLTEVRKDGIAANITFRDTTRSIAVRTVKRFKDYINLFFLVDIDERQASVEFLPTDEAEREQLAVFKFDLTSQKRQSDIPFSMISQAMFAGDNSSDDPSFASTLSKMAREAISEKLFIEAFRYSFLLFEGLFGGGKFKTNQLVDALHKSGDFTDQIQETLHEMRNDPLYARNKGRQFANRHNDVLSVIKEFVDKRGFYFHGNISKHNSWKPDQQEHAEELACFTVTLATNVAMSFSKAMFVDQIGKKIFDNAKSMGAIMTFQVQYVEIDEDGNQSRRHYNATVPGTIPTSRIAVYLHKKFLEFAETELDGKTLLYAEARDLKTGAQLFHSKYLGGTPAASEPK